MTRTAEATQEQAKRYVGGGVLRKEDPELLTGEARFIDDITLPGMLWVGVVRSPFAHARINGVDGSRALDLPGVVAVFSGEELAGEWEAALPCAWPIATRSWPTPTDEDPRLPDHFPLATDKARFAGDGVAVVVAETRAAVKDALEAVDIDYEPLELVLDLEDALREGAPR
ncbi:MAG: xanthine dehydrogenase family protein molybdopterin-binding subunit, partial [Actinomycetota bacterium]|nr:xanthine dehydrogenase family protein molybdopterin-binding subunit [Actinomycetota bacterium]